MTYIKLLTVLAGLALLTACAGGVTINPTVINNGEGTSVPCEMNPFGDACLADTDLNPRRVAIVSDCRTDDTGELCEDAIEFACGISIDDTICNGIMKYEDLRKAVRNTCLMRTTPEACDEETRVTKCDARPFFDDCIEPKYVMQRRIECESMKNKSQCMATEELICGTNGDVFDPFCNGITNYVSVRETTCQTHGTDPDDGDPTCAKILIPLCGIADPFAHAGCDNVEGINANIRTPYCQTPANAWKPKCMDGMHGAVTATRVTACEMFGTNTDMGGHDSCATSLATACDIRNPFAHMGCDDVTDIDTGVRTPYCQMPANAFTTGCKTDGTHGTVTATRMTACQMFGTDTTTGGHDSCATSLESVCVAADPFIHPGCDDVVGIDMGLRKTYCALTVNAFKTKCKTDSTHGDVLAARGKACVEFGIDTNAGGHGSCIGNTLAESSCAMNPFDPLKRGCAILTEFPMIVAKYCTTTNPSAPECAVKTSAWVASFGEGKAPPARLTATTPATERKRQFLTGLATGLDTTGTVSIPEGANLTLTLGATEPTSAKYNDEFLGGAGDEKDGYGLFFDNVDTSSSSRVYYAGLLADTDLGAPLTQASGSVTWYGQIQIFRNGGFDTIHPANNFTLEITFGGTNGVAGSIVGIVAGVNNPSTNPHYRVNGTYDAGGVISGTVTYGTFTGSPLATTASANGILTGLIGAQGAVGVFLAGTAGSTKDNIEGDGNSGTAYGGGFVAAPYIPAEEDDADKVTFRDWLREFDYPLPTSSAVEIARTTSKPHFIRPKTDGTLDLTGVTGTTQHKATRAGDDKDGFAYGVGKIVTASTPAGISHNFVGILPSTDLGAPLTEAIAKAKWPGQFSFGNTATLNDIEFTLTFDGTNSGTIDGMFGFVRFDLDFDGKGIITGDVTYSPSGTNPTTTVARGLIGEEGLVGVFTNINNGNTAGIEFGGFVADYVAPALRVATHANFKTYYTHTDRRAERTLQADLTTGGPYAFVEGTATSLPIDDLTFPLSDNFMPVTVRLKEEETGDNGFAVMYGLVSGNQPRFRAGLLSETDLGPALSGTSTATWAGSLHWANAVSGLVRVALDTVTVDFDNGTIKADAVTVRSERTVAIDGLFRAGSNNNGLDPGILGGHAIYTDGVPARLPLIGLIGTEGAIGVYHDGTSVVGGFQASPN